MNVSIILIILILIILFLSFSLTSICWQNLGHKLLFKKNRISILTSSNHAKSRGIFHEDANENKKRFAVYKQAVKNQIFQFHKSKPKFAGLKQEIYDREAELVYTYHVTELETFKTLIKSINAKLKTLEVSTSPEFHVVGDVHGSLLLLFAPLVQSGLISLLSSGNYFDYSFDTKRFSVKFTASKSVVAYTGDIVERAYHSHSISMLLFVLEIATKHPSQIKFTFGNHDLDLVFGSGMEEYKIIEEEFTESHHDLELNRIDMLSFIVRAIKNYLSVPDVMPFICYLPEYKTVISHTFQYQPEYTQNVNSRAVYKSTQTARCHHMSLFNLREFFEKYPHFKDLSIPFETLNLVLINEFLKKSLSKLLVDVDESIFNICNFDEGKSTLDGYLYSIIRSFLWHRPVTYDSEFKLDTSKIVKYSNEYVYHVIGHSSIDSSRTVEIPLKNKKLIFNDFSSNNSIDKLVSKWVVIKKCSTLRYQELSISTSFIVDRFQRIDWHFDKLMKAIESYSQK